MQRISIVGTSGSGKTTLARQVSQILGIPHIELDTLNWEPNWVEVPDEVMQERVIKALSANSWVVDGNYSQVRDVVWAKADTVVFFRLLFSTRYQPSFEANITAEYNATGSLQRQS